MAAAYITIERVLADDFSPYLIDSDFSVNQFNCWLNEFIVCQTSHCV